MSGTTQVMTPLEVLLQPPTGGAWMLDSSGVCDPSSGGDMATAWIVRGENGDDLGRKPNVRRAAPENSGNLAAWYAIGASIVAAIERMNPDDPPAEFIIRAGNQIVLAQLNETAACNVDLHRRCRDRALDLLRSVGVRWRTQYLTKDENREASDLARQAFKAAFGRLPRDWSRDRRAG